MPERGPDMKKRTRRRMPREVNPLGGLAAIAAARPVDKERRDRLMLKFRSALESMVRGAAPDTDDWRLISDVINTIETLSEHMRKLPVDQTKTLLDAAVQGMVAAAQRWQAGQGMRLDGPALQAIRSLMDIYEQCLELLSEREMGAARDETQRRLNEIYRRGGAPGQDVVIL